MTKAQEVGARIAQARREKGVRDKADVRPADVARALGVSQATISDWESGKTKPRDDSMDLLAEFLGVTPAFLRYGVGPGAAVNQALAGARRLTEEELDRADVITERAARSKQKPAAKPAKKGAGGRKR